VSEYDEVTDGVGSQETLLFCLFEGQGRAFDASRLVLDLVAIAIATYFVAVKLVASLLHTEKESGSSTGPGTGYSKAGLSWFSSDLQGKYRNSAPN
jgi:hypothetical protein